MASDPTAPPPRVEVITSVQRRASVAQGAGWTLVVVDTAGAILFIFPLDAEELLEATSR